MHPQHVGAQVCEQHGRERPWADPDQLHDLHVVQWAGHGSSLTSASDTRGAPPRGRDATWLDGVERPPVTGRDDAAVRAVRRAPCRLEGRRIAFS